MNIRIKTDFNFSVSSIQYAPNGELQIILTSGEKQTGSRYQYTACLGSGQAEEKPAISLLGYARSFASSADVKTKTKDSYRLMCNHLETYGDITIDRITTDYLQDYIQPLQLVRIIDFAVSKKKSIFAAWNDIKGYICT